MADFDAQLPVRAIPTEFATEVANSSGTIINPVEEFPQGATTSGESGALVQGATTTAAPTYTTATTNPLSLTTAGALRTDSSATTQPVSGTVTANQGTPAIVANAWPVITESGSTTTVTGNVTVVQPTGSNLNVDVSNFPATQVVTGNLTNNNAAPAANNVGVLPAEANAANPTWTEGDQVLLSEDLSGHLRTRDAADGPASPGTASTVSELVGGIYNSTPPTVTNGQQVSLQVDANGRLLVDTNASPSITPVLTYFTDAAVASGATTTHSLAGPVILDRIDSTSSGEMKLTVAIGTTGSEVTYWQGFNSAARQDISFILPFPYTIPSGSSAKVTLKNRDTAAQDLYVTFFSH
jgi:hypothetical protein